MKEGGHVIAKNDNMLAILWMLNSGVKMTAKQISQKLEINIRTVYRYIDALCASGVPVVSDSGHNGGYSLQNNFIKVPLLFDIEEKKALLQAASFAKEAGYPLSEALDNATSKLRLYSSQEQEGILNHQLSGIEVINSMISSSIQQILLELDQAIEQERSVEIDYLTGQEENSKNRIIDPYGMVYWNHKWYMVAFCHLRNDIRIFRIDRILLMKNTTITFKRPKDFSSRTFFMKNLLPDLADNKRLMLLIIEGKSEPLNELCMHWFLRHHIKERTSNQAIFLFDEKAFHAFVPYLLLSYGKSIQVIEPQSLKEKLIAIASELIEYYQI